MRLPRGWAVATRAWGLEWVNVFCLCTFVLVYEVLERDCEFFVRIILILGDTE